MTYLKTIISERFTGKITSTRVVESELTRLAVSPPKSFPGMMESTFLSRSFADQGVKLRIRKEPRTMMYVAGSVEKLRWLTALQETLGSAARRIPPKHSSSIAGASSSSNSSYHWLWGLSSGSPRLHVLRCASSQASPDLRRLWAARHL